MQLLTKQFPFTIEDWDLLLSPEPMDIAEPQVTVNEEPQEVGRYRFLGFVEEESAILPPITPVVETSGTSFSAAGEGLLEVGRYHFLGFR